MNVDVNVNVIVVVDETSKQITINPIFFFCASYHMISYILLISIPFFHLNSW